MNINKRQAAAFLLFGAMLLSACGGGPAAPAEATPAETVTPAAPSSTPTPADTPTPTPFPEEIVDEKGHVMRLIPAGEFTMGITDVQEEQLCLDNSAFPGMVCNVFYNTLHPVYLDAYYIDVYEVTMAEFAGFLNEVGNLGTDDAYVQHWPEIIVGWATWIFPGEADFPHPPKVFEEDGVFIVPEGFDEHPVLNATWYGAQAYCEWRGAGLPTEAQWEKAARGTDERFFPWGNEFIPANANAEPSEDDFVYTSPVGSHPAGVSPYGIHDMAGNALEWVADWYVWEFDPADYETQNPAGPQEPSTTYSDDLLPFKMVRGGHFQMDGYLVSATYRSYHVPGYEWDVAGFRCARPLVQP